MMLRKRISALEKALGTQSGDGPCQCREIGIGAIIWPSGQRMENGPCPQCGLVRPTLRVIYDDEPT